MRMPFLSSRIAAAIRASLTGLALLGLVVIGGGSFLLTDGGMRLALSQAGFTVGPNATVLEKLMASGQPPTITGGTLSNGSTNFRGAATATATGTNIVITFTGTAFNNTPFCIVTDQTIGSSGGGVVTPTATTLTIAGVTTAHVYQYICIGIN